jgi:hypothetical protein
MAFWSPFLIFVLFEVVCILALLMLWLDLEYSASFAMLYGHASAEVIAALHPDAHRPPPSRDDRAGEFPGRAGDILVERCHDVLHEDEGAWEKQ